MQFSLDSSTAPMICVSNQQNVESNMNADLGIFAAQMARTILMALVPVILTAFVSMPLALERHPGEVTSAGPSVEKHMT